ncbi:hypothetical protein [Pseudaestuariivita rosea]|uniref:hypothetical protein n=1 Tax=Pseudaestuariivita rosea TaxID=2763263 RepID=UPI001ABA8C6F|nr:hypothetical protein [Pseudaestuariivita rosea]
MFDLDELSRWDDALATLSGDVPDLIRDLKPQVQEIPDQVRGCPFHQPARELQSA